MIAVPHDSAGCELVTEDDRLFNAAAMAALTGSKYGPLHKLTCRVSAGVVEIFGSVPSFYLKQLAQAAVQQLNPSAVVRNQVEVYGEADILVAKSCHDQATPKGK